MRLDSVGALDIPEFWMFSTALASQVAPVALLYNVADTNAGTLNFENYYPLTTPVRSPVLGSLITSGTVLKSGVISLKNTCNDLVLSSASGGKLQLTGKITGTAGIVAAGGGTVEVGYNGNDYTGNTTVASSTLLLYNGTLSKSLSATVSNNATLGGTGTFYNAAVTLNTGACVAPGANTNLIGTLTVSNLTFASNCTYRWDGSSAAGDRVRVLNSATLPSAMTVTVSRVDGSLLTGAAAIVDCVGAATISGDPAGWTIVPANKYYLSLSSSGKQVLLRPNSTGTAIVIF